MSESKFIFELPDPIFAIIFNCLCNETNARDVPLLSSEPYVPAAFAVSHLCKYWRNFSLQQPGWWSCIEISYPRQIPLLDAFLRRTKSPEKNILIDLHLNFIDIKWSLLPEEPDDNSTGWPQMRNLLIEHIPRCRKLVYRSNGIAGVQSALEWQFYRWPESLPKLEELVIEKCHSKYNMTDDRRERHYPLFPEGLPGLKTLKMGCRFTLPPHTYKQITSLHVYACCMTIWQFLAIIFECSGLETLAVYGDFYGDKICEVRDSVKLPCLLTFRLFDVSIFSTYLLSAAIQALELRELVLARITPYEPVTLEVSPRIADKYPKITRLTLMLDEMTETEARHAVHEAVACFPNAEELMLVGSGADCGLDFLREIANDQSAGFPDLKSITLETRYPLRGLLEARAKAKMRPLDEVCLSKEACGDRPDLEWIKKHVRKVEVRNKWQEIRNGGLLYPSDLYPVQTM